MDAKNFVVVFLKVVCDATSKLILFGTWILTYKSWNLDTNLIVTSYYGMVLLLMILNIVFSLEDWCEDEVPFFSLGTMIGTNIYF